MAHEVEGMNGGTAAVPTTKVFGVVTITVVIGIAEGVVPVDANENLS